MVLSSPQRQTNWEALDHSQKATRYNQEDVSAMGFMSFPFLSTKESPERWTAYENLLYSCLRTGDDKAAHFLLERLAARFGEKDERVMGLRGLFQEAMAEDHSALLKLLPEYDRILAENPTNTVMALDSPNTVHGH